MATKAFFKTNALFMSLVSFWYYSWLYAKPFDKDYHSYH